LSESNVNTYGANGKAKRLAELVQSVVLDDSTHIGRGRLAEYHLACFTICSELGWKNMPFPLNPFTVSNISHLYTLHASAKLSEDAKMQHTSSNADILDVF